VFGLVTGSAQPKEGADLYKVNAPLEAARAVVPEIQKEGVDAIVLLAHLDREDAQKIAAEVKGVSLMLGGQSMASSRYLDAMGESWWIDGGQKGKELHVVVMNLSAKGQVPFVVREQPDKLRGELAELDQRIKRYVEMANGPATAGTRSANPERYKGLIESMVKQREQLVEKAKGMVKAADDAPFLAFFTVPLSKALRDDEETLSLVTEFEKAYPNASAPHRAPMPTTAGGARSALSPDVVRPLRNLPRPEGKAAPGVQPAPAAPPGPAPAPPPAQPGK